MPTSEARRLPPTDPAAEYAEALAAFGARHLAGEGSAALVQAFHAVRNLPYFSGPDRSALAALRTGRGACTAKHVLLRDLLRGLGTPAVVEIVEGDYPVPDAVV